MAEQKKRTITLTDRPPVTIVEADWPVIAVAKGYSGQYECQANEVWSIRVRRHADGRAIVYATRDRGNGGMLIGYRGRSGGVLLDGFATAGDIVQWIRDVARDVGIPEDDVRACIADLPAEEI